MNKESDALERKLEIRNRELTEAHSHIAKLEEKLLKLKQYRRELKLLKEERRRLRGAPERRAGQVLLAPYRLLGKLLNPLRKTFRSKKPAHLGCTEPTEYQRWFEQHRAPAGNLAAMRQEVRA